MAMDVLGMQLHKPPPPPPPPPLPPLPLPPPPPPPPPVSHTVRACVEGAIKGVIASRAREEQTAVVD
eukprot:3318645-Prymnesium_polylepis.1